ncbi:transporter substrate-binding domain-containing protein [Dinoroseobacter sp. S375]|uniref:transporter substrate-binding domain-containing protein n=1 Tax=Dinoroseobacter sp. S375 TaxID=3415136 RepID=UPI003C7A212E
MRFAYLIEPPFNFLGRDGVATGCDVELARYVAQQISAAPFEPDETEFADLLPGLSDGRWRMTTGLLQTDDRRRTAAFSRPIWAQSDGLLVRGDNPRRLSGYRSLARNREARFAVIRDQIQHRTALDLGVGQPQITVFDTYAHAAQAVRDGKVDAYASVGRAHSAFIAHVPDWGLALVPVPTEEAPPAFGAFVVHRDDRAFLRDVIAVLAAFLGTDAHRAILASFGASQDEPSRSAD